MDLLSADVFLEKLAEGRSRVENDIQSDIYAFLTLADLNLSEEEVVYTEVQTNDGTRRRIDVEIGKLCIEVKKNLGNRNQLAEGSEQLQGYLETKLDAGLGSFAGILTDGQLWILFQLDGRELRKVGSIDLKKVKPDSIYAWLQSIFATQEKIAPEPSEIISRLGEKSPAFLLDSAALADAYDSLSDHPEVKLKRELWAKLLRTALGTSFENSDEIFIAHTLLVLEAEMIGHAAVGFDPNQLAQSDPAGLVSGTYFDEAQIFGVAQNDFFDWPLLSAAGVGIVQTLARRISQFDWSVVEHDVLKVLYESVIGPEIRAALGEYYTPDWLADRVVSNVLEGEPVDSRVLDPSCGSGTFLLHAIRWKVTRLLEDEAEPGDIVDRVVGSVFGIDIHPVAVALARVTYILAIGTDLLKNPGRGVVNVPVYLGDSLQWEQGDDILSAGKFVRISTSNADEIVGPSSQLFSEDLVFPLKVMAQVDNFDALVREFSERASGKLTVQQMERTVANWSDRIPMNEDDQDALLGTLQALRTLNEEGRNHIWSYYIRNLVRPIWFGREENRVDVIVGNPPWLGYKKMPREMQSRSLNLLKGRRLADGSEGSSARDLSVLFVPSVCEHYLRAGGKFAFVMPHGVLSRKPHKSFRTGVWNGGSHYFADFNESWDLVDAATGFPHTSCVIFGNAGVSGPGPVGTEVLKWETTGVRSDVSWDEMSQRVSLSNSHVADTADEAGPRSVYMKDFRNGAVLHPRMLMHVERTSSNPLGSGAGRVLVESWRSPQEKKPWKLQPSIKGSIDSRYLFEIIHGQDSGPFRIMSKREVVLPLSPDDLHLLSEAEIDAEAGLRGWWQEASALFSEKNKGDETLLQRIDYFRQLSSQIPVARSRVVYAKAGRTLSASRTSDQHLLIDHKLYWAPTSSWEEAGYLTSILNSSVLADIVRPYQGVGNFGVRDFDKAVFRAPFPRFDGEEKIHLRLAELADECERIASQVQLDPSKTFQSRRKMIYTELEKAGKIPEIDELVSRLLGVGPGL